MKQRGGGGDSRYKSGRDPFQEGGARRKKTRHQTLHEKYCTRRLHGHGKGGRKKKFTSPEFVEDSSDDEGVGMLTPPPTPPRTQEDEDMANVLLALQSQPAGPSSRITRRGNTVYRRAANAPVRRSARNQKGNGFLPTAAAILGGLSNYTNLIPANVNKILRIACRSRCARLTRKKKKQSGGIFLPRSSPPFWNPQDHYAF